MLHEGKIKNAPKGYKLCLARSIQKELDMCNNEDMICSNALKNLLVNGGCVDKSDVVDKKCLKKILVLLSA